MNIKVIGAGCDKCDELYDNLIKALDELKITAEIEKIEDLIEIVKLGVMTTPTLMVDGKAMSAGQVLSKEKIMKFLKK